MSDFYRSHIRVAESVGKDLPLLIAHQMADEIDRLRTELAESKAEVKRLSNGLPKTADGVPVVWNQEVWWLTSSGSVQSVRVVIPKRSPRMNDITSDSVAFTDCYSTREAALAARKEQQ